MGSERLEAAATGVAGVVLAVDDGGPKGLVHVVVGARAFVATAEGAVWCLAVADGAPRWRYQASGSARLAASNETLYVADSSGELVALPID